MYFAADIVPRQPAAEAQSEEYGEGKGGLQPPLAVEAKMTIDVKTTGYAIAGVSVQPWIPSNYRELRVLLQSDSMGAYPS